MSHVLCRINDVIYGSHKSLIKSREIICDCVTECNLNIGKPINFSDDQKMLVKGNNINLKAERDGGLSL